MRAQLIVFFRPSNPCRELVHPENKILGDGHFRHDREMLVDHTQPKRMRLSRVRNTDIPAIDDDLARIGLMVAEQTFHKRTFAGSVFSEKCMQPARLKTSRNGIERLYAAETFGQICYFDRRWIFHAHDFHRDSDSSLGAPARRYDADEL